MTKETVKKVLGDIKKVRYEREIKNLLRRDLRLKEALRTVDEKLRELNYTR